MENEIKKLMYGISKQFIENELKFKMPNFNKFEIRKNQLYYTYNNIVIVIKYCDDREIVVDYSKYNNHYLTSYKKYFNLYDIDKFKIISF